MARHDCIVLYNAASIVEWEGSKEKIYPSNIIRDEVGAIEDSLRESGFEPYVLSVNNFSRELVDAVTEIGPRFVFNLCEEINGKCELEMCVAGVLELMGVPYTGSDPFALGLALNKFHVKQILRSAGIPVASGFCCYPGQSIRRRKIRFPVFVKPARQDASLGINSGSVCYEEAHLEKQIAYIHQVYHQEALVEQFLDGREFNVAIMGDEHAEVLAISEIDFSLMPDGEPKIVSYRAKWDEESPMFLSTVPICPADVSPKLAGRIEDIALRSYRLVGCRDYGRVDMRTDSKGNLYVMEVNPNPDISPRAGYARAALAAGYTYSSMIFRISEAAMERGARVAAAVYAF